jgi:hypothetical protein
VSEDSHSSTKDRVKALLLEGLSVTEIARRLGVSKPTVCFHKRTLGIEIDSKFGRRYDWVEIRDRFAGATSNPARVPRAMTRSLLPAFDVTAST